MALILELTPDEETRVADAKAKGIDVSKILRETIAKLPITEKTTQPALQETTPQPPKPMTGKEIIEYWNRTGCRGVFANREEDALTIARELRRKADTRQ